MHELTDHATIREWETSQLSPEERQSDAYREAAEKFIRVLEIVMGHLDRTPKWWQAQYALGTSFCMGKTMTERAESLGLGRAAISKGATDLCRRAELPPSFHMKKEAAQKQFQDKRNNRVKSDQKA